MVQIFNHVIGMAGSGPSTAFQHSWCDGVNIGAGIGRTRVSCIRDVPCGRGNIKNRHIIQIAIPVAASEHHEPVTRTVVATTGVRISSAYINSCTVQYHPAIRWECCQFWIGGCTHKRDGKKQNEKHLHDRTLLL
ncbi:MAG: hypothetical protein JNL74_11845 [Fibrobacteres bacterium]|nr:hypothetical protein [Fibrobacterota bacterium]